MKSNKHKNNVHTFNPKKTKSKQNQEVHAVVICYNQFICVSF